LLVSKIIGFSLLGWLLMNGATTGSSQREAFEYAYVVATYSCPQTGKEVSVFSQVFGACYQETNHSQIANSQRDTFAEVAKAVCGGEPRFSGQRSGYPYHGLPGEAKAEEERGRDIREVARYRKVESTYLQTPYSTKCQ
jgi:hypothetical protein